MVVEVYGCVLVFVEGIVGWCIGDVCVGCCCVVVMWGQVGDVYYCGVCVVDVEWIGWVVLCYYDVGVVEVQLGVVVVNVQMFVEVECCVQLGYCCVQVGVKQYWNYCVGGYGMVGWGSGFICEYCIGCQGGMYGNDFSVSCDVVGCRL